jgi:hypothetical protein
MKVVKIALVAVAAAVLLSGCCWSNCMKPKCYPYPLYDYSPARVCAKPCAPVCNPCAVK